VDEGERNMNTSRPLTAVQRAALRAASRKGGVHVGTGKDAPEKRCSTQTANLLVGRGLAVHVQLVLLITKAGRTELTRPLPEDPPVFLHQRDGLTTLRSSAAAGESEVIDPETLAPWWREQAARAKHEAADRRAEARKHADRARRAA
jgi:hypothetical protein